MSIPESLALVRGRWVSLRPVGREDFPTLFRWRSTFDVNMLNFSRRVATYEEFVGEIERVLPSSIFWLVRDNQLRAPIGFTIGYQLNPWDGWMFVGAYIEKEFRYRGHGGEATLLSLDLIFRMYPLRMVYTEIYEFAEQLLKLARALGFEEVGYQPNHYWHDDRHWGVYRMVLTRARWEESRDRLTDLLDVQEQLARREVARARGPK